MQRRHLLKAAAGAAASFPLVLAARDAAAQAAGTVLAVISHPVKDYAAWRAVYDGADAIRKKAGVTGAEVFRDSKDPNLIIVIHRFKTVESAQGFLADPALKDAMTKAGVTAPPKVILAVAA